MHVIRRKFQSVGHTDSQMRPEFAFYKPSQSLNAQNFQRIVCIPHPSSQGPNEQNFRRISFIWFIKKIILKWFRQNVILKCLPRKVILKWHHQKVILKWLRPSIHRLRTCLEYIHRLHVPNTSINDTHSIHTKCSKIQNIYCLVPISVLRHAICSFLLREIVLAQSQTFVLKFKQSRLSKTKQDFSKISKINFAICKKMRGLTWY